MAMTLAYWDTHGLAYTIHLLLEHTDSKLWGKEICDGGRSNYDRNQWLNETFKLSLDFRNLPYLIDKAHKITQSNAIPHCIAHKHN